MSYATRRLLTAAACILTASCAADERAPAAQPDAPAVQAADAAAAPAIRLQDLTWLTGSWRGTGEGEEFHEDIRLEDDSTMVIVYYEDAARTIVQRIRGTIEQRGGRIWHSYGDARWVVNEGSPTSLSFEPVQNARNRFTWTRESQDRWTAVLRYPDPAGGEVTGTYVMERIAPR
jgi:hypothetical protein